MNKRVIFLSNYIFNLGGIERYNRDFINELYNQDVTVDVIMRMPGGILSKFNFIIRILYYLSKNKYDYMICGHLNFIIIALLIRLLYKIPYSVSLYGIEVISLKSRIKILGLLYSSKLIVISNYTKNLIKQQLNINDNKFHLMKSSIDEDFYNIKKIDLNLKQKYGLKDNEICILTLSRLSDTEEKGQHRVILALNYVLKKFPNVKYLIAGPGSDSRIDRVFIQYPALKNSVIFTGPVNEEEKLELYNLCDLFILLSKNEGFGIVFIESLSCGGRVIASDGYGCREGLFNGELGQLVDPDNIEVIADTLINEIKNYVVVNRIDKKNIIRNKTINIYGRQPWKRSVMQFTDEIKSI